MSISPQSHHDGADAFSSLNNCNASLLREGYDVLLLVVQFVVLNADDYFALMAFQMARPILYVAWHIILSASDCNIHVQILTCLD